MSSQVLVAAVRAALDAAGAEHIVASVASHRITLAINGTRVGEIDANYTFRTYASQLHAYECRGPHIPCAANQRYGEGKMRRKSLDKLIADALPYLRIDSPQEAAWRASNETIARWFRWRSSPRLARIDEALFAVLHGEAETVRANPDVAQWIDEMREDTLARAAHSATGEMFALFDASLA